MFNFLVSVLWFIVVTIIVAAVIGLFVIVATVLFAFLVNILPILVVVAMIGMTMAGCACCK